MKPEAVPIPLTRSAPRTSKERAEDMRNRKNQASSVLRRMVERKVHTIRVTYLELRKTHVVEGTYKVTWSMHRGRKGDGRKATQVCVGESLDDAPVKRLVHIPTTHIIDIQPVF